MSTPGDDELAEALERFQDACRRVDEDPAERARIQAIAADAWLPDGDCGKFYGTPLERLMYPCGPLGYWPLPPS